MGLSNDFIHGNIFEIFNTNNIFYAKIESWSKLSTYEQSDSLKNFIAAHPTYFPAYLKLEERSLVSNRINELMKHFKKVDTENPQYGNAQWMLARHYNFLRDYKKAKYSYEQALLFAQPCYELIFDYLSFLWRTDLLSLKLINQSIQGMQNVNTVIVKSYAHLLSSEYELASNIFKSCYPFKDLSVWRQYYISVYKSGDISRALEISEEANKIAQKYGDQYYQNLFLLSSLKCRSWLFGSHAILQELEVLENNLESFDDFRLLNNLLKFKADLANSDFNNKIALSFYEQAAVGYKVLHDLNQAAQSYYNLAEQLYLIDNNTRAIQTIAESLSLIDHDDNFEILAHIWHLYGKIYLNSSMYDMSEKYLQKAADYASKTGN
ncbi:hypothetical protein JXA02_04675, partial [candidate division KSB1 bacterium]